MLLTKKDLEVSGFEWSIEDSIGDSIWDSIEDSIGDSIWDSIEDSIGDSIWIPIWDCIIGSVKPSIGKKLR